jgi:hypothetical protein
MKPDCRFLQVEDLENINGVVFHTVILCYEPENKV